MANRIDGTSLQGYVRTTYKYLVEKLGEPDLVPSGDEKVICSWIIEDSDTIATIYLWKKREIPFSVHNWNIGGYSSLAVDVVNRKLRGPDYCSPVMETE